MRTLAIGVFLAAMAAAVPAQNNAVAAGPAELEVDNLKAPLGIDDPAPHFSWQLHDPARGAKQTAYRITVASRADRLLAGKPDVWDSGRVDSARSIGVSYGGPALKASTRYYWHIELWGAAGRPYHFMPIDWWGTGLVSQDASRAQWIGYETPEEATVRQAPAAWIANPDAKSPEGGNGPEQRFDYRKTVTLAQPVRFAAIYATGQDTVAAWINGTQVLTEDPLTPYKQMPWKKFVRADVTKNLGAGANTVAIETLHYVVNPN
jgi:alpha-L-rhamnosidase